MTIERDVDRCDPRKAAVEDGMRLLRHDGLEKVRLGITSIAEVSRVT